MDQLERRGASWRDPVVGWCLLRDVQLGLDLEQREAGAVLAVEAAGSSEMAVSSSEVARAWSLEAPWRAWQQLAQRDASVTWVLGASGPAARRRWFRMAAGVPTGRQVELDATQRRELRQALGRTHERGERSESVPGTHQQWSRLGARALSLASGAAPDQRRQGLRELLLELA